jgi:hypothetical protein
MKSVDRSEVIGARLVFLRPTLCVLCSVFATGTLAAQEPKAGSTCAGLTVTLKADIDRMKKLKERAKNEENAPPTDLLSAWQRTFGQKGDGVPSLKELQKVRERSEGLNESLRGQGCATIDIEQALLNQ